jgi:hypothetical protein
VVLFGGGKPHSIVCSLVAFVAQYEDNLVLNVDREAAEREADLGRECGDRLQHELMGDSLALFDGEERVVQWIAKQAEMQPSEARVIHQRPAVIQELEWRPQHSLAYSPQADPVQEVLFSFYNGDLFRMVVNYDQIRTEGLTDEDMVEAISAMYGTATQPAAKVVLFSSSQVYNDSENVIARWEDSKYSFNLFRSSYQPTFGMLVFSKRLDPLAQAAIVEAMRLDEQEAPQREVALQNKRDEENRSTQARAKLVNKAAFRP